MPQDIRETRCRLQLGRWVKFEVLMFFSAACSISVPTQDGHLANDNVLTGSGVLTSTDPNQQNPLLEPGAVEPNSKYGFSVVGRYDESDPLGIRFKFGGLKLGVNFTGTSLAANITDTGTDLFNVVIDGTSMPTFRLEANQPPRHVIAQGLQPGPHTAWILKRTEALSGFASQTGIVQLRSFEADPNGQILPPPKLKQRRIEAIGDSGFTGWGVDTIVTGPDNDCDGNNNLIEDEQKSIPAQTALVLEAECINLSISGAGVAESVVNLDPNYTLPVTSIETLPPKPQPTYLFPADQAVDVVILSAGGDDLFGAYGSGASRDPNRLLATYTAWLQFIRQKRPGALIVNCISQSADKQDKITLRDLYTQAISRAAGPGGDANMVVFDYFAGTPYQTYNQLAGVSGLKLYWGCSGHPSYAGAQWLGARLAAFIKTKKGWD